MISVLNNQYYIIQNVLTDFTCELTYKLVFKHWINLFPVKFHSFKESKPKPKPISKPKLDNVLYKRCLNCIELLFYTVLTFSIHIIELSL